MFKRPRPSHRRIRQRIASGCLAAALPLYGFVAMVSALLGPAHFHVAPAATPMLIGPMAGWQDFRRADHVGDSVFHVHDHSTIGRHHHAVDDPSVVRVDAGPGALADVIASNPLPLVIALLGAVTLAVAAPARTHTAGFARPACAFASCPRRRLFRPPIA